MFKGILIMGIIILYGFPSAGSELDKIFSAGKNVQSENHTLPTFFGNMKNKKVFSSKDIAWHMVGPGEGGTCRYIYVHPKNPELVFMFNDMTSAYRSENGGQSWQSIIDCDSNGKTPSLVEGMDFSQMRPELGYAARRPGLFKTEDCGKTWEKVKYDFEGPICSVAIAPDDDKTIFVGSGQKSAIYTAGRQVNAGKLFVSRNGGASWTEIFNKVAPDAQILKIHIEPKTLKGKRSIFVATTSGFFVSRNDGTNWNKAENGLPHGQCADLAVFRNAANNKLIFYLVLWTKINFDSKKPTFTGGVFKSNNGGENWHEISGNLYFNFANFTPYMKQSFGVALSIQAKRAGKAYHASNNYDKIIQRFNTIAVNSKNPDIIYLGVLGYNGVHPFAPYGIWKTIDGGKNWEMVTIRGKEWRSSLWKNRGQRTKNNVDIGWLIHKKASISGLPYNQFDTRSMAISKTNPDIVYFSTVHAVYKSDCGGKAWKNVDTAHVKGNTWRGRGNSNIVAYRAFMDSRTPNVVFLGSMDVGLIKSEDYGKTFCNSYPIWGDAESLAFHPANPNIVFAGKARGPSGSRGIILKSTNAGKSWKKISNPVNDASRVKSPVIFPINCIKIEKRQDPAKARMYLCSASITKTHFHFECTKPGSGIMFSDDYGVNWNKSNAGLGTNLNVSDLIIQPQNQNVLYASVLAFRCPKARKLYYGGLFTSNDRGQNWRRLPLPDEILSVNKIHINPKKTTTIYIATGNLQTNPFDDFYASGGVYRSDDSGKNWQKIFYSPYCSWVTSDPSNPNTIYVCSADPWGWGIVKNPGIFRSKDGGNSWEKINHGLASPSGAISLVFHPTKPEIIWAGTTNSGWYVNKMEK